MAMIVALMVIVSMENVQKGVVLIRTVQRIKCVKMVNVFLMYVISMMNVDKETSVLIILVLLNASQIMTARLEKNASGLIVLFHQEGLVKKIQVQIQTL